MPVLTNPSNSVPSHSSRGQKLLKYANEANGPSPVCEVLGVIAQFVRDFLTPLQSACWFRPGPRHTQTGVLVKGYFSHLLKLLPFKEPSFVGSVPAHRLATVSDGTSQPEFKVIGPDKPLSQLLGSCVMITPAFGFQFVSFTRPCSSLFCKCSLPATKKII